VQIAATHPRGLHLDDDFVGARGWIGKFHQLDLAIALEHHAAHRFLSSHLEYGSKTSLPRFPPARHYPDRKQRGSPAMPVNKPHLEFHRVDMSAGWSTPPGYPPGIDQKILAGALDEERRSGNRTRLLRFAPGVFTTAP